MDEAAPNPFNPVPVGDTENIGNVAQVKDFFRHKIEERRKDRAEFDKDRAEKRALTKLADEKQKQAETEFENHLVEMSSDDENHR